MIQKIRVRIFAYLLPGLLFLAVGCSMGGAGGGDTSVTTSDEVPHSITINGSTLTWDPPTKYTDDSSLAVASYNVYYGTALGTYNGSGSPIAISKGTTTTDVSSLFSGSSDTYYFAVTAVDASGVESDYSNEVGKFITIP